MSIKLVRINVNNNNLSAQEDEYKTCADVQNVSATNEKKLQLNMALVYSFCDAFRLNIFGFG